MIEKEIFELIKNDERVQKYISTPRKIKLGIRPVIEKNNIDLSKIYYVQWTGTKDKNGRETYEGDIVKFQSKYMVEPAIGIVLFDEARFFVSTMKPGKLKFNTGSKIAETTTSTEYNWNVDFYHGDIIPNFAWSQLEVIGNIFDIFESEM